MDIVTKICKAMCSDYGDGCKKCSMGNPEAEYSCSVYDDAQLAAKFLDETISDYEKKLEDKNLEIAQLKQELKAADLRIAELEKERSVKANELIENIFECISDILFNNHRFPGPGEDFEPYYYEDVFEDVARLKIRLEEKYVAQINR